MQIGDRIYSGSIMYKEKSKDFLVLGSSLSLVNIPVFTRVFNLERYVFSGGILSRAAGTSAIIASKITDIEFLVKLKSG